MSTKTKTKAKVKKTVDPMIAVIRAISDNGLSLRNGLQQIMGTVVKDNPGEEETRRVHRLRSVTGRMKWFIRTSTEFLRSLQSLRNHIDNLG